MKPLNPVLYQRLKSLFREVRVVHQGEKNRLKYERVNGKLTVSILYPGEEYNICCPFCGDMRYRLYVNHQWGTFDKKVGKRLYHFVHCFNDTDCMSKFQVRKEFYRLVYKRGKIKPKVNFNNVNTIDLESLTYKLPQMKPIVDLPESSPVLLYLKLRGYSIDELWELWRVGYCEDESDYLAYGRIIAPVMDEGMVVGWQGRVPFDSVAGVGLKEVGIQKYISQVRPRYFAYNLDRAIRLGFVVLVEGVFDAWRVGTSGVALLGHNLSDRIISRLSCASLGKGVHVVWLGEGDVFYHADVQRNLGKLKASLSTPLRVVCLDQGVDPSNLSREEVWQLVYKAKKM